MMARTGLIALAFVAGCNSGGAGTREVNPVLRMATQFFPAINNLPGVGGEATPVPGFSSSDIAANPSGFVLMQVDFYGEEPALSRLTAQNARTETWESQNGFSVSYQDDIMIATRGLGEDLLAGSVSGIREAIRAGGGEGRRVHDSIGDLNQIVQESFECTVTAVDAEEINLGLRRVETRKYAETCLSDRLQFTNNYWIDSSGVMVTSLQFVSEAVGYVRRSSL